jgi:hypothetical protein
VLVELELESLDLSDEDDFSDDDDLSDVDSEPLLLEPFDELLPDPRLSVR